MVLLAREQILAIAGLDRDGFAAWLRTGFRRLASNQASPAPFDPIHHYLGGGEDITDDIASAFYLLRTDEQDAFLGGLADAFAMMNLRLAVDRRAAMFLLRLGAKVACYALLKVIPAAIFSSGFAGADDPSAERLRSLATDVAIELAIHTPDALRALEEIAQSGSFRRTAAGSLLFALCRVEPQATIRHVQMLEAPLVELFGPEPVVADMLWLQRATLIVDLTEVVSPAYMQSLVDYARSHPAWPLAWMGDIFLDEQRFGLLSAAARSQLLEYRTKLATDAPSSREMEQAERAARAEVPVSRPVRRRTRHTRRSRESGFWRINGLCEIGNFAMLRRHVGRPRAERLPLDVALRIADLVPDVRVATAGRSMVEIAFERDAPESAASDIDRMRKAFLRPIDLEGERFQLDMLFGVAAAPPGERGDVRLAEAAEAALGQAHDEGRVVMLDLSRANLAFDKLTLMRELPRAIANGETFMQYQPKVNIRHQAVVGAEAVLRWQHPARGLMLPGDFIAVAEQAGEIGTLTLWTLGQVIADQKRLAADGHDIPLFVHISGALLTDAAFIAKASAMISNGGARIGFEITETAVIRDPESAIRHLQAFADIGVTLAIDDYGAGLSSLAYLKQLPARELKIDKMFVMQLTSSNRDPLIVRSTIDLAHALEMEVTAEGVETPSALALLSVMGCDMVQGFLISRPLGIEAFRAFLADDNNLGAHGGAQSSFIRPESFWKRA